MRSKADETFVIVETLICPLQILHVFCVLFKIYCILTLKYKNNTSYQKLTLLRKSVVGNNLTNTEAEKLLDNSVSKPVFEFVI